MGKSIYFTDAELVELECCMEFYQPDDPDDRKAAESAYFKLGRALDRPWTRSKPEQKEG
jgi:hypothetical protein